MGTWINWAGNQKATGLSTEHPRSTEEVAATVAQAARQGRQVKVVGAGHSFTAIAEPQDVMLDLSALDELHSADPQTGMATVGAGSRLHRLNDLLAGRGLALTNLGDVDVQTIAGAMSTGTHGTGALFGGLSTQVEGFEVVLADGSVVDCSRSVRPELWAAGRVGLGALGILTKVTVRAVPLFGLRAEEGPMPLDEVLGRFDELAETCDHFEAYWFPHTRIALTKCNTRLPLAQGLDPLPAWRKWLDDEFLSNRGFGWLVALGQRQPSWIPAFNQVAGRALGSRSFTDLSYKVFTSPRRVRFKEMELAIPRPMAVDAIREVVSALESSHLKVGFPVELRVAAGDDIPLSMASGRDTAYLAFHVPAAVDHEPYFRLMSRVLDLFGARPHWGKMHFSDAELLRTRYPRFDEFVALRQTLDPDGVLSNPYLDRVLGPSRRVSSSNAVD